MPGRNLNLTKEIKVAGKVTACGMVTTHRNQFCIYLRDSWLFKPKQEQCIMRFRIKCIITEQKFEEKNVLCGNILILYTK